MVRKDRFTHPQPPGPTSQDRPPERAPSEIAPSDPCEHKHDRCERAESALAAVLETMRIASSAPARSGRYAVVARARARPSAAHVQILAIDERCRRWRVPSHGTSTRPSTAARTRAFGKRSGRRGTFQVVWGNGEWPWVRAGFRGGSAGRRGGARGVTVQGAGAAHQTLKNVLGDAPPEPRGRKTAAAHHASGRRRLARSGMHAAAGAAIWIGLGRSRV